MTLLKKLCGLVLLLFALMPCWALNTSTDAEDSTTTDTKDASVTAQTSDETNTSTDTKKPIIVRSSSPIFTIRLAANATTGYQWYLVDYDPRFIKLLEQQYVNTQNKHLLGAPGISVWRFQAQQIAFIAPHATHITFEYRRAWEPRAVKKQSFTVITQQPTP